MSTHTEARLEVSDMKVVPHGHQQMFKGQEDTTFLMPSPDDALPPTVLRQLQEYSSRMDASSLDGSARSTSNPQIHFPSILSPSDAMPSSHSSQKFHSVTTYVSKQKRKLADSGKDV